MKCQCGQTAWFFPTCTDCMEPTCAACTVPGSFREGERDRSDGDFIELIHWETVVCKTCETGEASMVIGKHLTPEDVRECLDIHSASDWTPTADECATFLRLLIAGYDGMKLEHVTTADLKGLALVATRYRRSEPTPEPRDADPLHERFSA